MENGMDKFPGHAYAPGMEPTFWDNFFIASSHPSFGPVGWLTLALTAIALLCIFARLAGPGNRRRRSGHATLRTTSGLPPISADRGASVASVITKTLVDQSAARDLRHARAKVGADRAQPDAN